MPHIDVEKIPKIEMRSICKALIAGMEAFYSDPENMRRFEEWKASPDGQAYIQRQKKTEVAK